MRSPTKPLAKQPTAMPALKAALPIQLLRARESVMAWFRPHLREHKLTDHHWRVLRVLAENDGLEMQELSKACEVQPPSLSRIMPKLDEQGLIRRETDATDQRRIVAWLTPAGKRLVDTVSVGSTAIYSALIDAVGRDRLQEIQEALDELVTALDTARPGRRHEPDNHQASPMQESGARASGRPPATRRRCRCAARQVP